MIIKIKKHNLCSNWLLVFMSDTDKQTLIDLYEILVIENLKEVYQNRSVLIIAVSARFNVLLSILVILSRRVFLSARKLGQWRSK